MRKFAVCLIALLVLWGCARVNIATDEPIKLDISMRVDVYQHVVEDVKSIEDQIYGDDGAFLFETILGIKEVYAAGDLDAAVAGRKSRLGKIEQFSSQGYIGEDRGGYVQVMNQNVPSNLKGEISALVDQENRDRRIIYESIAQKNGAAVSETGKVFFEDHYKRAPAGYWFEIYDASAGQYIWKQK